MTGNAWEVYTEAASSGTMLERFERLTGPEPDMRAAVAGIETQMPRKIPGHFHLREILGCGSFTSAGDLGFRFEPIFHVMAVSTAAGLVQFVGANADLFHDCLCASLA